MLNFFFFGPYTDSNGLYLVWTPTWLYWQIVFTTTIFFNCRSIGRI